MLQPRKEPQKQKAKRKREEAEPYIPKVIVTEEGDGETVVVIDDGTGKDLEPVSEDGSDEEGEGADDYDANVIPEGEFEDDPDGDEELPESTFAASVAKTVANVVGASTQQSEEIKVKT